MSSTTAPHGGCLPVVGKGALQNISDLDLLHGIDMAILQDDVLNYARQQNLFPGIENRITYVAKLYNEEFHLLARRDIKTVADLANQKVNVDLRGGRHRDHREPAVRSAQYPDRRHQRRPGGGARQAAPRRDRRAGLCRRQARAAVSAASTAEDGLHFLAIPVTPTITAAYVADPAHRRRIIRAWSPADQPVDTVAVGAVLAVANLQPDSERYRNVVNFVDAFFTGFQSLLTPGHDPKWREVNIAAELPGWRRFPPAAAWLQRNAPSRQPSPTSRI